MSSSTVAPSIKARIRQIVVAAVHLPVDTASLGDGDSLYEAGMDSHASVNLMIALEAEFGFEFPNRLLKRSVFDSIDSIASAVEQLQAA